jgi:hypothetical protein
MICFLTLTEQEILRTFTQFLNYLPYEAIGNQHFTNEIAPQIMADFPHIVAVYITNSITLLS